MNVLHTIFYFFFLMCLNNSCLFLTCKYVKKINLTMRKEKKIKEPLVYIPRSLNQKKYIDTLIDDNIDLIIAVGPAGTGKTLFACLKAISQLKNGEIKKLVVTRPVVTVEEEIGFLPGNIDKKMDPWTRPIFDLFLEFFSKSELEGFMYKNMIEISPLAFMRGRTFKNSFIIADEMQNSSPNQMKMLTTRIGVNSKMVITGDLNQSDIQIKNGLEDLIERINKYNNTNCNLKNIRIIEFDKYDIERSDIVKNIINIYDFNNNITTSKNISLSNDNAITKKYSINNNNENDAALIPKHHISKNSDIFFDNSNSL